MGRNQLHALTFLTRNPGWHTFATDRATTNAVAGLVRRGLAKVNEFNQFTLA